MSENEMAKARMIGVCTMLESTFPAIVIGHVDLHNYPIIVTTVSNWMIGDTEICQESDETAYLMEAMAECLRAAGWVVMNRWIKYPDGTIAPPDHIIEEKTDE
jgi:hypothetical protein